MKGRRQAFHFLAFRLTLRSPPLLHLCCQGDGSNALVELRTYRVPPKITFQVLQVR